MNNSICCLCGDSIVKTPNDLSLSMDHVPPRQFYPKELRKTKILNLWSVPTHKHCNEYYREDEEYFYHSMFPVVRNGNTQMGEMLYSDFKRRKDNPQTPAMMRKILNTGTTVTEEGIHLPPGSVMLNIDKFRIQRVVIKIAQELFFLDEGIYMPCKNCKDIRLCHNPLDVPELYRLSWNGAKGKAVHDAVFSYRGFKFENLYLISLLFWESVMFCCSFEYPLLLMNNCKTP